MSKLEIQRFPEFLTPRLALRGLRAGDEAFLASLDADPSVMRHIHTGALSPEEALLFARSQVEMAAYRRHWGKWLAVLRAGAVALGWVELGKLSGPDRDDLMLGYEFAPAHCGRGYATEAAATVLEYAFASLELDRVAAIARPANIASLRVLEKLGFREVGQRRDDGSELCNEYRLTLLGWQRRTGLELL